MLKFITMFLILLFAFNAKAQLVYPDADCFLRHQDMIALVKPSLPDVDEKTWTTFREIPVWLAQNPQGLHFCAMRFSVYIETKLETQADVLFLTDANSVTFVGSSNFKFDDMTKDNLRFVAFELLSDVNWQNFLPIEDTFNPEIFCRNHDVVIQAKYAWIKYSVDQTHLPMFALSFAWAKDTKMDFVGARMLDSRVECGYKYTGKIALQQQIVFERYDNGQFIVLDDGLGNR